MLLNNFITDMNIVFCLLNERLKITIQNMILNLKSVI